MTHKLVPTELVMIFLKRWIDLQLTLALADDVVHYSTFNKVRFLV